MPTSVTLYNITPYSKTHFLLSSITGIATGRHSDKLEATNKKRAEKGETLIRERRPKWSICADGSFQAVVAFRTAKSFLNDVRDAIPQSLRDVFYADLVTSPAYPGTLFLFIGLKKPCAEIDALLPDGPNYNHNRALMEHIITKLPGDKKLPLKKIDPRIEYKVFCTLEQDCMYLYNLPGFFAENATYIRLPFSPDDFDMFKVDFATNRKALIEALPPQIKITIPTPEGTELPDSNSSDSLAELNGEEAAAATEASSKAISPILAAAPIPAAATSVTATGTTTTVLPMLSPVIPSMFNSALGFAMNLTANVGGTLLSAQDAVVGTLITVADTFTSALTTSSTAAATSEEEEYRGFLAPTTRTTNDGAESDLLYEMDDLALEGDKPPTPASRPTTPDLK